VTLDATDSILRRLVLVKPGQSKCIQYLSGNMPPGVSVASLCRHLGLVKSHVSCMALYVINSPDLIALTIDSFADDPCTRDFIFFHDCSLLEICVVYSCCVMDLCC